MGNLPPINELMSRARQATSQQQQQQAIAQAQHFNFASVRINSASLMLQGMTSPDDSPEEMEKCLDHALKMADELMIRSGLGFKVEPAGD